VRPEERMDDSSLAALALRGAEGEPAAGQGDGGR
jgi:hypothetical protein